MKTHAVILGILVAILECVTLQPSASSTRTLSFDERVRAQEAIERVYYAHQIGATSSFEEAVPRAAFENKVRQNLKQTAALQEYWRIPVTAAMLERETERMARETRMPGRLRELFAALGDDTFLIHECLARPALVDRLARSSFEHDERIHGATRRDAEILRAELADGRLDPAADHPRRTVLDLALQTDAARDPRKQSIAGDDGFEASSPRRLEVAPEQFARSRRALRGRVGDIGPLIEERDGFAIRILMDESQQHLRVATFYFPKKSWDSWWTEARKQFDEDRVQPVARTDAAPPSVLASTGGAGAEEQPTFGDSEASAASVSAAADEEVSPNDSQEDVPAPRRGHTAVWTGAVMIVWGGYSDLFGGCLNTGGRYDPATDSWTPTSTTNAPEGRDRHTAVWTGSEMIVWGGRSRYYYENTGGRYNPVTDTWTPTSDKEAPLARAEHTAVWAAESKAMIIWGGRETNVILNTGGIYFPETDEWRPTPIEQAPESRRGHTAVWAAEAKAMIVWGGSAGTYQHLNTGGLLLFDSPGAWKWRPTSEQGAPSARSGHTAVWATDGVERMIVWGGLGTYYYRTGALYDPSTDVWTPTNASNAPTARYRHTAVWTGKGMVVWGGIISDPPPNPPISVRTGGVYSPWEDSWTATTTLNAPVARYDHTAVSTGDMMVVWGGINERVGGDMNTGGRYVPGEDVWSPTSIGGVPAARMEHTAIWTGSEMVVWGGHDQGYRELDTGGRYDPALDVWSATTRDNAPSRRRLHTAVWTGNAMVVWGGVYHSLYESWQHLNTGGRYDPRTDSWRATSTVNAPSARDVHTAIWTGNAMIVWGGDTLDRSGGRYYPSSNTWLPTSMVNAPAMRMGHTAVWTGAVMVVWGGYSCGAWVRTGGRYNPVSDTWNPTNEFYAPWHRADHSAIWTGTEMIIWGGELAYEPLKTGGRYNPSTDTWRDTSMTGAPRPRWRHAAVWTGDAMIVWGGFCDSWMSPECDRYPDLGEGCMYTPTTDTWRPITSADEPHPRESHSAVWTGSEMIVWGGYVYEVGAVDTGGRYSVLNDSWKETSAK